MSKSEENLCPACGQEKILIRKKIIIDGQKFWGGSASICQNKYCLRFTDITKVETWEVER